MRYYRIHTADIAYITQQPRGIFTAIGKLVDAGNPDKAITWFKDTPEGNRIYSEMTFYHEMARKYGTQLYMSECDEIPGEIIYEDDFQIAIKNQRTDIRITTHKI